MTLMRCRQYLHGRNRHAAYLSCLPEMMMRLDLLPAFAGAHMVGLAAMVLRCVRSRMK